MAGSISSWFTTSGGIPQPSRSAETSRNKRRTYCHPEYYAPLANALYHNRGDGTFEDVSALQRHRQPIAAREWESLSPTTITTALPTSSSPTTRSRISSSITSENGRFEEVAVRAGVAFNSDGRAVSGMGADFRDVDNDGREDILLTALSNEGFSLFRNLGGSLQRHIPGRPRYGRQSAALRLERRHLRFQQRWSQGSVRRKRPCPYQL